MENSKIEWTHHTANLWWGCTKVHDGCDNCYALAQSKRYGFEVWGADKPRRQIINVWKMLEKYQKTAFEKGEIHRVFVGSMMDIFEKPMSLVDSKGAELIEGDAEFWHTGQLRNKFFNEVIPNSPNLMFLLLTKRPSNINKYIPEDWKVNPPNNVMFGTSPVNQKTANMLIQQLAKVNGLRFVSIEPQLEVIDLMKTFGDESLLSMIDWVIQGGESGSGKRPFNTEWARTIRNDCKTENVPYFFKQIDKIQEIPEDLKIREFLQVKTNYEKATIPKVKRTGAVNQKNEDMNEIKFFNVNSNSHVILLVDGSPSPGEYIQLIKEDSAELFYQVISSEILADVDLPYSDGMEELEDVPNGIEEISEEQFSNYIRFVENDVNNEFAFYTATIVLNKN